jgi:hypothetical protein
MKNIIKLSILLFCIPFYSQAQSTSTKKRPAIINEIQNDYSKGQVQIIEDKRIDDLFNKYIDYEAGKKTIPGFRIRIFSKNNQDGGRKHAYEIQSKFLSNYPAIDAEVKYDTPDWKVYVGYFRTITDALKVKKQIEGLFPNAFIVNIEIDFTKI